MDQIGPRGTELRRSASRWRACAWLAAATVSLSALYTWSYRDCTRAFFHFDDYWVLAAADRIHICSLGDCLQFFQPATGFLLYRPVSTTLYFYLLKLAFGHNPVGYHVTQIGFHILNALLVYAIADTLFRSRALGVASALVYATAPGHAIAACWNALFTMTGTAFFYFLGLWVWLAVDSRWRVPVTVGVFVVALLASEHAVSFPVVLTIAALTVSAPQPWRQMLREQAAFYLLSITYVGAKLYYLHALLPLTFPSPVVQAYVRTGYGVSFAPLPILQHLGQYFGFALDLAYGVMTSRGVTIAVGGGLIVAAAALTAGVVSARWSSRPVRVMAFGVDLFIVALGPVLVLPNHIYSYYVGIAALGLAVALVALASLAPRIGRIAPGVLVAAVLAMHVGVSAAAVRRSDEFRFFNDFSRNALRWLYTLSVVTMGQGITEVVVPRDGLTQTVFDTGEAQRLFLCAKYRVRTSTAIDKVVPFADTLVLRTPLPLPGNEQSADFWAWLQRGCSD